MKKFFLLLFIVPSIVFAQKDFVINGNIAGLPDGMVKLTSTADNNQVITAAESKNGIFTLKGSIAEPTLYWITFGKEQPQYIFLESGNIKISGSQKDIKDFKVEGSSSHKDFLEFEKVFNPLIGNLNNVAAQINQSPENKREELMKQYEAAVKKINDEAGKFIAPRRSSYVSVFLLEVTRQLSDVIELNKKYNLLDAKIKGSEMGKDLASYISIASVGAIGSDALDFTQADPDGKPVKLSSFKGKYVLVDFWASWCKPCRAENPNVVKAYNKFKNKNFTILSVSLDQAKENWVKAIDADNLKWTHVSDLKQWNNEVAVMYHVQSIPQNFLVDPKGKIVAKDLRGEDLERKLCELLGCK